MGRPQWNVFQLYYVMGASVFRYDSCFHSPSIKDVLIRCRSSKAAMRSLNSGPEISALSCRRSRQRSESFAARFYHFVDLDEALSPAQDHRLRALLSYAPACSDAEDDLRILVIPRLGTVSPWSSKATEIARNCLLDKVERIERGILYGFVLEGSLDRDRVGRSRRTSA